MIHKIIIVGAGPIGLYLASKCKDYLILEATSNIGGQLTTKYPEKEIVDIPGIKTIKSKDYIKFLESKVDLNKIIFNEKVVDIIRGNPIKVVTANNEFLAKNVVIATGLGFSTPRPLGLDNESHCKNILYLLQDYEFLADKKIAIFGGGDSALDWAKTLSKISNNVSLIHRRTEFRGNPNTIKDCKNLKLYLPYVPFSLECENGLAKSVKIKLVSENEDKYVDLPVDCIFVNFGAVPEISSFNFPKKGAFFLVNQNCEVEPHIFVIGDAAEYENKTRRIAPGLAEADKVLKVIC